MNRNKKLIVTISVFAIAVGCGYFVYPSVKLSTSSQCLANPGWTICENANNNIHAGALMIIFLDFGLLALIIIQPNDSIPDIPVYDIDS